MEQRTVRCEVWRQVPGEPASEAEACADLRGSEVFAVARSEDEEGRPVVQMAYAGQPGASQEDMALCRYRAWLALGEAVARDGAAPEGVRALCREVLRAAGAP